MAEDRFLLDSNILIYLIEGSSSDLRARLERLSPGQAMTSVICVAEVLVGLAGGDGRPLSAFDRLLSIVPPQPFDVEAARVFPSVPFHRGRSDRFIAAHALALGATLITNNERDFRDVPNLRLENWTRPS